MWHSSSIQQNEERPPLSGSSPPSSLPSSSDENLSSSGYHILSVVRQLLRYIWQVYPCRLSPTLSPEQIIRLWNTSSQNTVRLEALRDSQPKFFSRGCLLLWSSCCRCWYNTIIDCRKLSQALLLRRSHTRVYMSSIGTGGPKVIVRLVFSVLSKLTSRSNELQIPRGVSFWVLSNVCIHSRYLPSCVKIDICEVIAQNLPFR